MATPLNPEQRRAVHHVEGPLLVLAGPGSGKTRVVTHRIARLLKRGIEPKHILAVTFTNKAAREMRERVRKLLSGNRRRKTGAGKRGGAAGLTIATFHSACARILREEAEALGYRNNFSIYDDSDQQSLMRSVLRDLGGYGETKSAASVLFEVGAAKANPPLAPDAVAADEAEAVPLDPEEEARRVFVRHASDRYQSELLARNAMDFDDILLLTLRLFREHPDVLERWRDRYRFLLVDEYQDTNRTQDDILTLLAGDRRNLCVVGDDNQSIYGWRGARVDLILDFAKRWGPKTEVVMLEQNYRSTQAIVGAARSVIDKNPKRHKKELFTRKGLGTPVRSVELKDDEDEARFIASEIARGVAKSTEDPWQATTPYAVLFRTNEQMRPIEQALRQSNLPYRLLGGRSFFDRKEVLDVMAHLRLSANPDDEEALLRVINTPARGLGAKAIRALGEHARQAGTSLWQALADVAADKAVPDDLPRRAPEAVGRFVGAIERVRTAAERRSPTLIPDLLADIGYRDELERVYKDVKVQQVRWDLALEVNKAWEAYLADASEPSLIGFLDGLALRDRDDDKEDATGVTLATVHASKGLEFDEVFVAGLEEGFFPHRRSVDDGRELAEERRVLFVALTRARQRLTLTRAGERTIRGQTAQTIPSRFLDDLNGADEVEQVDGNAPASEEAAASQVSRMRALLGD